MEIEARETTKAVTLRALNLREPLYISCGQDEIWICTVFNEIKVGIVGGKEYTLKGREFVPYVAPEPLMYKVKQD
jgi:hypothetical protein